MNPAHTWGVNRGLPSVLGEEEEDKDEEGGDNEDKARGLLRGFGEEEDKLLEGF